MTVTTEEAEWLAKQHDLVRFTLGMKAPEHDLTAAALRSLAAERDALRDAELDAIRDAEQKLAHRDNLIEEFVAIGTRERSKRDALQKRVAELERLGKAIAIERNQLIGVLQLAVEQSGEIGENEPAWLDPACRILNAGFTKSAALEGKP